MFSHIFWDFDGTLFDTYPVMAETCRRVLNELGHSAIHGEIMAEMKISMSHALRYCEEKYGIGPEVVDTFKRQVKADERLYCRPFDEIPAILRSVCRAGKKNYIYTHRGESTFELLGQFGLCEYFSDSVTSADGFARKPSPQALLYLLEKHRIPREEALMVGDRDLDILAAKNAGIQGCYFDESSDKSNPLADFTIHNYAELYGIVGL